MIYDKNGQRLMNVYGADGNSLLRAYDSDGEIIFTPKIKIMAYNVGQWYTGDHVNVPESEEDAYYALQGGIIERNDPDILLLEEYTAQFGESGKTALSLLSAYPYRHTITDGSATNGLQRAVFSKFPIKRYTEHNYISVYYYDSCVINDDIFLCIVHLPWNNRANRISCANIMLEDAQTSGYKYFIFGGDFNTADYYDTTGADYAVIQPFITAGCHVANGTNFGFIPTYSDYSDMTDYQCLDNIITSPNITILDAYTDNTKATDDIIAKIDHLPFIAELQFN